MTTNTHTPEPWAASARLIAAAPDLLAALELAVIPLQIAERELPNEGPDYNTDFSRALSEARAAIAKAKGE